MSFFVAAQLIGVIAVIISLVVFQLNRRDTMLKLAMSEAVLYAVHFFFLGALTGAVISLIGAGRSFVFTKIKPGRKNRWVLFVFIGLAAVATVFTWQGPISLLPLGGAIGHGVAFWQSDPKYIRMWSLAAPPLWFTYNAMVGSYPGMFIEIAMLISILVGRYRLDFGRKHHLRRHLARPS
jgi:hypothetical protein